MIAATNRVDVLDPALLRPQRLSRNIYIGLRSEEGRLAITKIHAKGKPLDNNVNMNELAATTAGQSGADLAEMINEGAIMAARANSQTITQEHLKEGLLRVLAGPRKASTMLAEGERELFAYHEAGHALCSEFCESTEPTLHVTINPRGKAGGFALTGRKDRSTYSEQYVHEQLICLLGGRAAEYVTYGYVSSGASNDLQQASGLARDAIEQFGFSSKVGQGVAGQRGLSAQMQAHSDDEVRRLVDDAYRDAVSLIKEHTPQLKRLAETLLQAGDVDRPEIVAALQGGASVAHRPRSAFANQQPNQQHYLQPDRRLDQQHEEVFVGEPKTRRAFRRQPTRGIIGALATTISKLRRQQGPAL